MNEAVSTVISTGSPAESSSVHHKLNKSPGRIGMIVFAAVMWLALPHMPLTLGFVTAGFAWLAVSVIVWQLRRTLR